MFNMNEGYHLFGMHMLWWLFWIVLIGIIFGVYGPVRRNRRRKDKNSLPGRSETPKDDMK